MTQRIARLKDTYGFLEAARTVLPWLDLPDHPGMVLCPRPEHDEKTPSCSLRESFWFCHGCKEGGDALDLIRAVLGDTLPEALARAEAALGLDGDADAALLGLTVVRESSSAQKRRWSVRRWRARLDRIEDEFRPRAVLYLRSPNPSLAAYARRLCFARFDQLTELALAGPDSPLADRTRLRRVERACRTTLALLDRRSKSRHGWDVADVALLSLRPDAVPADVRRNLAHVDALDPSRLRRVGQALGFLPLQPTVPRALRDTTQEFQNPT